MRRFVALNAVLFFLLISGVAFLGCGGGGAATGPVASITLTPAVVSLNRGATVQITAQALDKNNNIVSAPVLAYHSDNPAITVSNNGLICAGQWDANFIRCYTCSNPLASNLCTAPPGPGPNDSNLLPLARGASITATATVNNLTLTSSAVVVTDHERIDSVRVIPDPGNPADCISQNGTGMFTAQAFSSDPAVCSPAAPPCRIPDDTLGNINWFVSPSQIATPDLTLHPPAIPVTVTAAAPGQGVVTGSVGTGQSTTVSDSVAFVTCPVASIHVQQKNTPTGTDTLTSFTAPVGGVVPLVAEVFDVKGVQLTSTLALTWLTSQPALASVSPSTTQGVTIQALAPGTASISAACLPASCNLNLNRPIYSDDVVTATITGTLNGSVSVTTSTAPANTTSSNAVVSISTTANSASTALTLPANLQVNSMALAPLGSTLFLGTNCASGTTGPNGAACSGLLRFDPAATTVGTPVTSITGKVLATDGTRVVLADPPACPSCTPPVTPTQIFIVSVSGTSVEATLPIANATAAAFAIDGSKIYIVAGSKLFIYSPTLPLQSINLNGTASASSQSAAFFATGAMAYVADSAGDDVVAICDGALYSPNPTVAVGNSPTHIAAVPNASAMVDANTPNIDEIHASANSQATNGACPPLITNSFNPASDSHGFPGVPGFAAKQLIVTPDSKLAIILTSDHGVLMYGIGSQPPQTSVVQLSGGPPTPQPVSGGVTPDSANLYVGATDGKVHRLDLTKTSPTDTPITVSLCPSVTGGCNPDFLVVRPVAPSLTSITVTPANPSISVGKTQQFTATGHFSDGTSRDLTNFVIWDSLNTRVAVIGPTAPGVVPVITTPGLAQALATGTATINATTVGIMGSTTLTVVQ